MNPYLVRRRLMTAGGGKFVVIVNGIEYKPGDTVTITASTTITVTGRGTAKVTLVGGGGASGAASDEAQEYYIAGGSGGDGGMSVFTTELKPGTYAVTIGHGGTAVVYGSGNNGGTTTAFGHSAGGGYGGGYAFDEYGSGATDGANGVGETSSGNNTAYGQGGSAVSHIRGYDGTAGVCIIKIIDPNVKGYTVTTTGVFDATYSYVTINGEKVTSAGEFFVPVDGVITLATKNKTSNVRNTIKVNGTTVRQPTTTATATYDYIVEGNCTITGTMTKGVTASYDTYHLSLVTTG